MRLILLSLMLCSCQHLNSVPAYPPEIAEEPCFWHEGGRLYVIDKNGVHEIVQPCRLPDASKR